MMTREQREVLEEYLAADQTQREVIKQAYAVALADIKAQTQALMNKLPTSSVLYQLQYKKAMAEQIEGILTLLESQLVNDTTDYLAGVYNNGFYGSAYSMAAQGVPIAFGVDQKQLAAAINVKIDDYKFSDRIRDNVDNLKRVTKMEITRGIANGSTYAEIARHISQHTDENIRRAQIITRTEAHRVQNTAREDAMHEAKKRGADIVKMWDSTLDGKTRRTHRKLDGQIKELDEPFEVDGHKAMRPGGFGRPEEDINCRCQVLERARWALKGKRRKLDNENQFDADGNLNYISTDDKRYTEWKTELEKALKKQSEQQKPMKIARTRSDAYDILKNGIGFADVSKSLDYIDEEIVVAQTNQISALNKRFGVIGEGFSGYIGAENSKKFAACTQGSFKSANSQNLVFSFDTYARGEKHLLDEVRRSVSSGYAMPCAESNYGIYTVTHEYGHMLENKIMASMVDMDEFWEKYRKAVGNASSAGIKKGQKLIKDTSDACAKEIFKEILVIAKEKNPDFSLKNNISDYGKSCYQEAFAETFANSQLGSANELGDAMNEWLKRKGF